MKDLNNYEEPFQNNTQETNNNNIQVSYQNNNPEPYQNNIQVSYQYNIQGPNQNNIQVPYQNNIPGPYQNHLNEVVANKDKIKRLNIIYYPIMVILIIADTVLVIITMDKINDSNYDPNDDSANNGGIGNLIIFIGLVGLSLIILCCSYCVCIPIIKIVIFILLCFFRWLFIHNNFFDENNQVSDFYGIMLEILNFIFLIIAISHQIIIKIKLKIKY